MSYTKINNDLSTITPSNTWQNLQITQATLSHRATMQANIDDFATFSWRGVKSWEVFGCFIISEKAGDLKFYNGSNFSNEYTKPLFDASHGHLMGVNFKQQTIQFKIGMYWFGMEDYRKFLNWLDPYEVNYLSFDFNPDYSYLVKLASFTDSPKYIVGKENGEPRYYTELTLNWEVQGDSVARSNNSNIWEATQVNNTITYTTTEDSELARPFILTMKYTPYNVDNTSTSVTHQIRLVANYTNNGETESTTLFDIVFDTNALSESAVQAEFQNSSSEPLSEITDIDNTDTSSNIDEYSFWIRYDSETGLIFRSDIGQTWDLLSLLSTTTVGKNLVSSLFSKKFLIPGSFDNLNISNFSLELTVFDLNTYNDSDYNITSYSRISIA